MSRRSLAWYIIELCRSYRDLKPETVTVAQDGHVLLHDFHFACELAWNERRYSVCGTPEYMAPEMLMGAGYGAAVDWWAYGVLLYELLTGYPPFLATQRSDYAMMEDISVGKISWPSHVSVTARSLITQLLQPVAQRLGTGALGAWEIKKHPYFKGVRWSELAAKRIKAPQPWAMDSLESEDPWQVDPDRRRQKGHAPRLARATSLGSDSHINARSTAEDSDEEEAAAAAAANADQDNEEVEGNLPPQPQQLPHQQQQPLRRHLLWTPRTDAETPTTAPPPSPPEPLPSEPKRMVLMDLKGRATRGDIDSLRYTSANSRASFESFTDTLDSPQHRKPNFVVTGPRAAPAPTAAGSAPSQRNMFTRSNPSSLTKRAVKPKPRFVQLTAGSGHSSADSSPTATPQ